MGIEKKVYMFPKAFHSKFQLLKKNTREEAREYYKISIMKLSFYYLKKGFLISQKKKKLKKNQQCDRVGTIK